MSWAKRPLPDTPLPPTYYTCVEASGGVTLALNNGIGSTMTRTSA
jgi:hypothetical protein